MTLRIKHTGDYWYGVLRTPAGQIIDGFDDTTDGVIRKIMQRLKDKGVSGEFDVKYEIPKS